MRISPLNRTTNFGTGFLVRPYYNGGRVYYPISKIARIEDKRDGDSAKIIMDSAEVVETKKSQGWFLAELLKDADKEFADYFVIQDVK